MNERLRLAVRAARKAFAAHKAHVEACASCQTHQVCQIGHRYEVAWLLAGAKVR